MVEQGKIIDVKGFKHIIMKRVKGNTSINPWFWSRGNCMGNWRLAFPALSEH